MIYVMCILDCCVQAAKEKYGQIIKTSTLADFHILVNCACFFSRGGQSDLLPNCLGATFAYSGL